MAALLTGTALSTIASAQTAETPPAAQTPPAQTPPPQTPEPAPAPQATAPAPKVVPKAAPKAAPKEVVSPAVTPPQSSTNIGEIQAKAAPAPKPVLSQKGLTSSPTDFAEQQNKVAQAQSSATVTSATDFPESGIGSGPPRATTPGGVTGTDLGGGYMIQEEAKKTRSTVTRDAIDKMSPTANPYQMINLLPGVNQSSVDNTGLNGGNIKLRGFNSDKVGLTIEGMPVNDSGNYALYPQEYLDGENIEQISIAQGSPDLDSPHIGSSGGVINIFMRDPSKTPGGLASFSVGSDNLYREFVRVESGQVGPMRGFISFSQLQKDHWAEGEGEDERKHVDFKTVYDISPGNTIRFAGLYNEAVNNFYRNPSLLDFHRPGYEPGYNTTPGTADYYKYRTNPFQNLILSAPSNFTLTDQLRFDTVPYYWYGYGNGGGTGELREPNAYSGNVRITGVDFGPGSNALYYNPSITRTHRPGVINKFSYDVGNHTLVAGHWYEYASHRQTAPFIPLTANGNIDGDEWGDDNEYQLPSTAQCFITRQAGSGSGSATGSPVACPTGNLNRRNQKTETTTSMFFVGDTWKMTDWLTIDAGVKHTTIYRDLYNYLPDANPGASKLKDEVTLPTVGFKVQADRANQFFGSYAESFRSTPNFTLLAAYSITSGAYTPPTEVEPERGQIYEIGHRYQGALVATSVSAFLGEYDNFQLSTNRIDEASGGTSSVFQTINAGRVRNYGINAEIGTRPIYHFRPYVSGEWLRAELRDNLEARGTRGGVAETDYLPTAGKELPGAPNYSFGFGLDYDNGHFFANLSYKYTDAQFSTLTNDESIPGYDRVDASIGYRFADFGYMKQPELKLSLFNLFDNRDLVGVNGVQNNADVTTGVNGSTIAGNTGNFAPSYYMGAPFSTMVTFKTGF